MKRLLYLIAQIRPDAFYLYWQKTFPVSMVVGQKQDGTLIRFKQLPSNVRSQTFTTALQEWKAGRRKEFPFLPRRLRQIVLVWKYGYGMVE